MGRQDCTVESANILTCFVQIGIVETLVTISFVTGSVPESNISAVSQL